MDEIADLLKTIAHSAVKKRAITNHGVLNEAYAYAKPSSFSRGMRIDLNGLVILLISGTASIDEQGRSIHIGDFRAQMQRTLNNITGLLASEGATWHDIVRTTCYLRDIERDYAVFNEVRTAFMTEQGLGPAACLDRNPGHALPARAVGGDRGHRNVPRGTGCSRFRKLTALRGRDHLYEENSNHASHNRCRHHGTGPSRIRYA